MSLVSAVIWSCDDEPVEKKVKDIESGGFSLTLLDTAEVALSGVGVKLYYATVGYSDEPVLFRAEEVAAEAAFTGGELVDYLKTDDKGEVDFGDLFSGDYYVIIENVDVNGSKYFVSQYVQIISGENKKMEIMPSRYVATLNISMEEVRLETQYVTSPAADYTVLAIPYYLTSGSMSIADLKEIALASQTTDAEGQLVMSVPANVYVGILYFKEGLEVYNWLDENYYEIGEVEYLDDDIDINITEYYFEDEDADETTPYGGIGVLYVNTYDVLEELFDYDYDYVKASFSELMSYAANTAVTTGADGKATVEVMEDNYDVFFYLAENHFYWYTSEQYFDGPDFYGWDEFDINTDTVTITVEAAGTDSAIVGVQVAMVPITNLFKYDNDYTLSADEMLSESIATATTDEDGIAIFTAPRFDQDYVYFTFDPNDKKNWGYYFLYGSSTFSPIIDLVEDNGEFDWYDEWD